ncbi:MAG TPA: DM13 domain-containing protein [Solirubrobacteraceae bacterium]|nr:DM13 domain-containing protein [Solirubrobacteraceae bacterium]
MGGLTPGKLLAPPLVVLTLAVGLWFWAGVVAPGYWSTIVLGTLWFVACSVIFGRIAKSRPQLRPWMRGTFLVCCAAAVFGFYWTSVRDTVVDEDVVTGVPASRAAAPEVSGDPLAPQPELRKLRARANVVERSGAVRPQSHSASGTARVIKLPAGGRRLTLSDGFEIDPGPQVRVYLATDEAGRTFKDIGALKGNKGDQQYVIPASTDLTRYDTVVFWCVPFSQSLASAALET